MVLMQSVLASQESCIVMVTNNDRKNQRKYDITHVYERGRYPLTEKKIKITTGYHE